jgi:WD40 repeat protein
MVVLWDLTSPAEGVLLAKLPNSVYALDYVPEMGVLVAGHNYDGIHILDWRDRKELSSLKFTDAAIYDLQHDGTDMYIAGGDGVVTVVDLKTMTVKNRLNHSQSRVRTIAIHQKAGEFAVGYSDHFIRVFDLATHALKKEWQAHTNSVFTLRYSFDGRFLFSGARDARLKAWNADSDYALSEEVVAHMYAINSLSISPDGKHFVTCSLDKSIKLWDADQLKLLKVIDKARHAGHGTSVNKLLWTAHEGQIVSASDDRTISIWKFIF